MAHRRYTPTSLIAAVEKIRHRTPVNNCEGLMLAVERMIRLGKPLPRSCRKNYSNKWAYVAMEIGRNKFSSIRK